MHTDSHTQQDQLRGFVLDIGCARDPSRLRLEPSCHYIALKHPATEAIPGNGTPWVFGDTRALPFPDGFFDTVLLLEAPERLPDPRMAVDEAKRVLAPNGRLILSESIR